MAGELAGAGLDDHGVREVLDLCLECRACKSECPVGVDVARFKSEFLSGYYDRHGTPLTARALGHVHTLARWGSRFAPIANAIARSAAGRWVNEHAIGLDRRRLPPVWASAAFEDQFHARARQGNGLNESRPVALFNDTFTNYYNPAVGMAGVRVLESLGFDVSLAGNACCGRPLISQGLLDEARRAAFRNSLRLHATAERGTPIVFFEPSCLSAVVEDAPSLLRGDAKRRAQTIADRSVLFEELVDRHTQSGTGLHLGQGPSRIVLHGHCHQKAMGRVAPARALLARIPGSQVTELDSGCCGMAGSFGYHRAHFDVSRSIAERRILPAARALGPGDVMVASGISCRHQVHDFTGVRAWHPAELLDSLLTPDRP
jgi:Fe-S oxidoreductase